MPDFAIGPLFACDNVCRHRQQAFARPVAKNQRLASIRHGLDKFASGQSYAGAVDVFADDNELALHKLLRFWKHPIIINLPKNCNPQNNKNLRDLALICLIGV